VKEKGLVEENSSQSQGFRGGVKCDEDLSKVFGGQKAVPWHHVPEYIGRAVVPVGPVIIHYPLE
jgi:hypothetical protein